MRLYPHALATNAVLAAMVLFACTSNVVFAALLRVSDTFGVSPERFAAVASVQFSGFFLACLVGGVLADRLGKKSVMIGGCLLTALGGIGWALAPSIPAIYASAVLLGMGGGILETVGAAILTDLHPRHSKLTMNLSQAAYCVGAIGTPLVMGLLLPLGVSWRWFFAATGLSALLLGLACSAFTLPPHSQGSKQHGNWARTRGVLPSVAIPSLCIFLYVFSEMGIATFLNIYLRNTLHAPENMAIYALGAFWSAVIIGRIACAFIPQGQAYELVIAPLLLCASLCVIAQSFINSWQLSFALFFVLGLCFAGTWPLIVSMAASRNLADSGTAAGITIAFGSLGCIFNPLVLGPLFDSGQAQRVFVLLSFFLFFASYLMFLSLLQQRPAQANTAAPES
jgi:fucose permease